MNRRIFRAKLRRGADALFRGLVGANGDGGFE